MDLEVNGQGHRLAPKPALPCAPLVEPKPPCPPGRPHPPSPPSPPSPPGAPKPALPCAPLVEPKPPCPPGRPHPPSPPSPPSRRCAASCGEISATAPPDDLGDLRDGQLDHARRSRASSGGARRLAGRYRPLRPPTISAICATVSSIMRAAPSVHRCRPPPRHGWNVTNAYLPFDQTSQLRPSTSAFRRRFIVAGHHHAMDGT